MHPNASISATAGDHLTMTTETTRRREDTRRRLVMAAFEEFSRRGIDATSVEHLCHAAGFTRGAFYSNFATKDDLCVEIMRHVAEEQVDTYQAALARLPEEMTADEIIAGILDVNEVGPEKTFGRDDNTVHILRRGSTGYLYQYAFAMILGLILLLAWLIKVAA